MSDTVTSTEVREQRGTSERRGAEPWARVAADAYAEIALLKSGHDDPEHRAKVREAHERALHMGSDYL
jgi:hypothetical protein